MAQDGSEKEPFSALFRLRQAMVTFALLLSAVLARMSHSLPTVPVAFELAYGRGRDHNSVLPSGPWPWNSRRRCRRHLRPK